MAGIVWSTSPTHLGRAIRDYGDRVRRATAALATFFAGEIEASAKENAPWTDRTGNARQSLHAFAEELAADAVAIYLAHGVDYGKWLELAHGGKYQIIAPTLTAFYPRVMAMLRAMLGAR